MIHTLEPSSYRDIEAAMLTQHADLPPAACLSNRLDRPPFPGEYDFSFSRQMHAVCDLDDPQLASQFATSPDLFLVTAASAVPVADAIRGFYEATGASHPVIDYIAANQEMAAAFREGYIRFNPWQKAFQTEVTRLIPRVESSQHVCVVDEFVAEGTTVQYAHQILKTAGIEVASTIRGKWYGQANRSEIDLERLTSIHAPYMRKIGLQACSQVIAA